MHIQYTRKFISLYRSLPTRIKYQAEKQELLFRNNVFHPSLYTEKLLPKNNNLWSSRINRQYRIVFHFQHNVVTFLYIGHHHEIYRLI